MKAISLLEEIELIEYKEFTYYLDRLESIDEGILDKLKSKLKDKLIFVKDLATNFNLKLSSLVTIFKDKKVFKFFKLIGWSLKSLFDLVKKGLSMANILASEIANYIASTKIAKWTEEELRKLDAWLEKNPKVSKIAGIGVAGLLLYIWMNMTFTGDFAYDFDFSDLLLALAGKFSLAKLFAGPEGIKLLMLFVTGMIGLSFPWPSSQSIQFVTAVLTGLSKLIGKKLKFK